MDKRIITSLALRTIAVVLMFAAGDVWAQEGGNVFAPAPVTAQESPTFMQSLVNMLPMLAICYLIFWVMVIRPQETKVKKHKELLDSLKRGDSVVTTGGLIGKVASVDKEVVTIEIAPNVKVRISQANIVGLEKGESKAEAA
jgi:preprotein translocase subunit YajC